MFNIFKGIFGFIKRHAVAVRLTVVVVLFAILLYNIRPRQIVAAFGQASPLYLLFVIVLMIPNVLLQILKWQYIMSKLSPKPSFKSVTFSVLGGFFLGAASPGRSGELARGFLMPGYSVIKIASLTVVDKGFNQVIVVITGLFSLMLLLPWPLSLIPFAGEVFVISVIFNLHRLEPKLERFFHKFTDSERVDSALAAFDALSIKTVSGMIVFSLIFYCIYFIQFYLMILCFVDLPLMTALKTLPVVYLFQLLMPVSFGDFGIKEMVTVKLLAPFGIGGAFAFSATLINNVITFLLPAMVGGIMLGFHRPQPDLVAHSSTGHTVHLSEKSHQQAVS